MVLGVIIKGVSIAAPIIARYALRYGRAEDKVFTRLYGTARGRGVRHGLAAGGITGGLISQGEDVLDDGEIPYLNGNKARAKDKARGGQFRNSGKGYRASRVSYHRKRCSCYRRNNRSRYRK